MQKSARLLLSLALIFLFVACSGKSDIPLQSVNPLGRAFGDPSDPDPLKIGQVPTRPIEQDVPALIEGDDRIPELSKTPPLFKKLSPTSFNVNDHFEDSLGPFLTDPADPFVATPTFKVRGVATGPLGLMNAGGSVLTIWALKAGNWVWGYTLLDSIPFGDARVWRFISFPKNFVMIKNVKTNTCLNSYLNGVIHMTCDVSNRAQFWELKSMSNQAVQIKNFAKGKCLQVPSDDPIKDSNRVFSIYLVDCETSDNIDQQWYVIGISSNAFPLFGVR